MRLPSYNRDLEAAKARIREAGCRLARTSHGAIEYVDFGEGPPVLWVHGVVGGCDQARRMASSYLGDGFRVIAPSRFGYLGSPLPADSSAAAQADTYAALLDELQIANAVVIGASAGTSSTFQFAIRHPDRCSALVLWSMAVPPYPPLPPFVLSALKLFLRSDLLWWESGRFTPAIRRLMGVPRQIEDRISKEDRNFLSETQASLMPVSARREGILNDVLVANPDLNRTYAFETLTTPSLLFHAEDDPWGAFSGARGVAARIPFSQFIAFERGGHLLLGHRAEVRASMSEFVSETARVVSRA
jgi:pimeloyl-ACP methyl ester carboxylesterase